jgi:hypothetical protein
MILSPSRDLLTMYSINVQEVDSTEEYESCIETPMKERKRYGPQHE